MILATIVFMKKKAFFSLLLVLMCAKARIFPQDFTRPIIESLHIKEADGKINLSWTLPEHFSAQSILVFRSKSQISSVKNSFPIAELLPTRTYFSDTPESGIDFYYCVLARTTDAGIFETIIPSVNASVQPVRIKPLEHYEAEKSADYADGHMRPTPLPALDLFDDLKKEGNIKNKQLLQAAKELSVLNGNIEKKTMKPHIFEADSPSNKSGDDYYLYQILKNSFIPEKYKKSMDELNDFLGIKRSKESTARAIFYLGESFYFLGDYRKAISHFLSVSDDFPELSRKWLDASLDLYELP